ncbi:MAG TPA: antibiotic biosynthesis monooxygenase [Tepidiformaceae bacterium]|jgi:quinol monooxygenase YgiN
MTYIRLSVVKPRPGQEARALEMLHALSAATAGSPGWQANHVMRPHDDSGELVRISIYEDEASAEREAASATVMALRSELHLVIEPGHRERGFFSV